MTRPNKNENLGWWASRSLLTTLIIITIWLNRIIESIFLLPVLFAWRERNRKRVRTWKSGSRNRSVDFRVRNFGKLKVSFGENCERPSPKRSISMWPHVTNRITIFIALFSTEKWVALSKFAHNLTRLSSALRNSQKTTWKKKSRFLFSYRQNEKKKTSSTNKNT